jgi:hypothetical protein
MANDERVARMLDVLNGCGFPFQLGMRSQIESTIATHKWEVIVEEHFWRHPEVPKSGYIDLLLQHKQYLFSIVIECKRIKDGGEWIFLTPRERSGDSLRLSAFWTRTGAAKSDRAGWIDQDFEPTSQEAAYCTQKGSDEKALLIEKLADNLLPSTEAVGKEEMRINTRTPGDDHPAMRVFLPMVVTNAALFSASFNSNDVDIMSGKIPIEKCEFHDVSYIRFRKGLWSQYPRLNAEAVPRGSWEPLRFAGLANERSLLVVNSAHLAATLASLRIPPGQNEKFVALLADLEQSSD